MVCLGCFAGCFIKHIGYWLGARVTRTAGAAVNATGVGLTTCGREKAQPLLSRADQLRRLGDIHRNPPWLIAHDLDQRRGSGLMVDFPLARSQIGRYS
jgi:hypothetical protein